ncbi:MAG: SEC-C metal-binding domain-containing protein [Terriglobales bacterium]
MYQPPLTAAYRYFRAQRETYAGTTFTHEPRHNAPKVGRNEPCPCGSGKKYKRCCGGASVN